jgi:hypothetical protein
MEEQKKLDHLEELLKTTGLERSTELLTEEIQDAGNDH